MAPASPESSSDSSTTYWYDHGDSAVTLLSALRSLRTADHDLRRRMSAAMDMNTTDLAALRFVIAAERSAEPVTSLRLAQHLRISGASTSKLLDRLTASGHLRRIPNPRDGRSRIVVATAHAHAEVRERLARMHARMLEIAQSVPPESRAATVEFLLTMAQLFDAEVPPEGLTPQGADEAPTADPAQM